MRLLDSKTQEEFAKAPVVASSSVVRVPTDSDRFVLRCVNKTTGQGTPVGLSFRDSGGADGSADANYATRFVNVLKDFTLLNSQPEPNAADVLARVS